jgi:hypothetical protein
MQRFALTQLAETSSFSRRFEFFISLGKELFLFARKLRR